MVDAVVESSNGGYAVSFGAQKLSIDPASTAGRPALKSYAGKKVILGIRPEHLEEASLAAGTPPDRRLRGNVELREALGSELMVHFTVEGAQAPSADEMKELASDTGAPEGDVLQTGGALFVGRFGARADVTEGKAVEVSVDTSALQFFDPETGLGIYDQHEKGAAS
jgi:multiple sugar transport system ATP-binding protein